MDHWVGEMEGVKSAKKKKGGAIYPSNYFATCPFYYYSVAPIDAKSRDVSFVHEIIHMSAVSETSSRFSRRETVESERDSAQINTYMRE